MSFPESTDVNQKEKAQIDTLISVGQLTEEKQVSLLALFLSFPYTRGSKIVLILL